MANEVNNKSDIPSKRLKSFNSVVADLLYSVIIGGDCVEYQSLTVSHNTVAELRHIRAIKPQIALVTIEQDPTATQEIVCRFLPQRGLVLSPTSGMPLGDGGTYWVRGYENIAAFIIMGCEPGKFHTMHIAYFQ